MDNVAKNTHASPPMMGKIAYISKTGDVRFGIIPLLSLTGTVRCGVSTQLWMRLFSLANNGRTMQSQIREGPKAAVGSG